MPEKFADFIHHSVGYIPFLMLTATEGKVKVNTTRIVEALVIAAVAGVVAGYISVQKMDVRIEYMERTITEVKQDVKDFKREVLGKLLGA